MKSYHDIVIIKHTSHFHVRFYIINTEILLFIFHFRIHVHHLLISLFFLLSPYFYIHALFLLLPNLCI